MHNMECYSGTNGEARRDSFDISRPISRTTTESCSTSCSDTYSTCSLAIRLQPAPDSRVVSPGTCFDSGLPRARLSGWRLPG
jgi:hypothetical protein